MKAKTIDIKEAIDCAKKWQDENKEHAKAFLIPANDLIDCLEEMKVLVKQSDGHYSIENITNSKIRAYMAIKRPADDTPTPQTEKLLLVGTLIDCNGVHRDLVEGEKPSGCPGKEIETAVANITGSGVYDFTEPCPNTCDPNSPLYNP